MRALVEAGNARGFASSARAGICTCTARSGITEEENLQLISETVRYLKDHGKEVVYDAEHFFDGYTANPRFRAAHARSREKRRRRRARACATPTAARSPAGWSKSCADVRKRFDGVLGIHTHNDSDVAVANAIAAVEAGATARARLHQRLRRALRQRQPRVRSSPISN